jgi:uncharacterized membrane protein YbhN (UPF0104 family)
MMTRPLRARVLMLAILGASLLAVLLAFGDVKKVVGLMMRFQHLDLLYILLVLVTYEAVQGLQWHTLLKALGIRVPLRAQAFAFLVGQPTRVLPIGNFFENYLLLRAEGTDFGLSSAATLTSVLIEVTVALTGLVILGLDDWEWLRPLIVIGVAIFVLGAWAIHRVQRARDLPAWLTRYNAVRVALVALRQFRSGAAALLHLRVLGRAGMLGTIYLLLASSALYVVVRGLGIDNVTWSQVVAVYLFSLAFGLIFPLPVDVGVAEISGVGAFLAIGVDKSAAVGAMLVMRAVSIGVGLVVALITILVLNDEFRASLRERPPATVSRPSPAVSRTHAPWQADEMVRAGMARERDAAEDAES